MDDLVTGYNGLVLGSLGGILLGWAGKCWMREADRRVRAGMARNAASFVGEREGRMVAEIEIDVAFRGARPLSPVTEMAWWLWRMRSYVSGADLSYLAGSFAALTGITPNSQDTDGALAFAYDEADGLVNYCVQRGILKEALPCLREIRAELWEKRYA